QDRLAMTQLAFADVKGAQVDPREMLRAGPTYTFDTLYELQQERPGAQLVLIMGADQAMSLPRWHRWQEIVAMAIIAVAYRPALAGGLAATAPRILPSPPAGA